MNRRNNLVESGKSRTWQVIKSYRIAAERNDKAGKISAGWEILYSQVSKQDGIAAARSTVQNEWGYSAGRPHVSMYGTSLSIRDSDEAFVAGCDPRRSFSGA